MLEVTCAKSGSGEICIDGGKCHLLIYAHQHHPLLNLNNNIPTPAPEHAAANTQPRKGTAPRTSARGMQTCREPPHWSANSSRFRKSCPLVQRKQASNPLPYGCLADHFPPALLRTLAPRSSRATFLLIRWRPAPCRPCIPESSHATRERTGVASRGICALPLLAKPSRSQARADCCSLDLTRDCRGERHGALHRILSRSSRRNSLARSNLDA